MLDVWAPRGAPHGPVPGGLQTLMAEVFMLLPPSSAGATLERTLPWPSACICEQYWAIKLLESSSKIKEFQTFKVHAGSGAFVFPSALGCVSRAPC